MAAKGIINARCFLPRYAPPNKAIAAMGVKLGQCGINLKKAPAMITEIIKNIPEFDFILLMFLFLVPANKDRNDLPSYILRLRF